MAEQALKDKIHDLLKGGVFGDAADFVDVSDGPIGDIHVVIVSRKLDRRRVKENHDLVWDELERALTPEEWGQVSLTVAVNPEQVKSVY